MVGIGAGGLGAGSGVGVSFFGRCFSVFPFDKFGKRGWPIAKKEQEHKK